MDAGDRFPDYIFCIVAGDSLAGGAYTGGLFCRRKAAQDPMGKPASGNTLDIVAIEKSCGCDFHHSRHCNAGIAGAGTPDHPDWHYFSEFPWKIPAGALADSIKTRSTCC